MQTNCSGSWRTFAWSPLPRGACRKQVMRAYLHFVSAPCWALALSVGAAKAGLFAAEVRGLGLRVAARRARQSARLHPYRTACANMYAEHTTPAHPEVAYGLSCFAFATALIWRLRCRFALEAPFFLSSCRSCCTGDNYWMNPHATSSLKLRALPTEPRILKCVPALRTSRTVPLRLLVRFDSCSSS